jgi:peptidoglycan/xylan/chitin deacetylase (PgdA/CDA1 family)
VKITAVNFHRVTDPEWFGMVIGYLKEKYEIISISTLEKMLSGGQSTNKACHLIVDDGDESFFRVIYPVLKKYDVPATLFVSPRIALLKENWWFQEVSGYDRGEFLSCIAHVTGIRIDPAIQNDTKSILRCFRIGQIHSIIRLYQDRTSTPPKNFQNMTAGQIITVDREGLVTIGAHTMNHPVLSNEDDETCFEEIAESIGQLEEILGHEIKYFAYPNGIKGLDFGEREMQILRQLDVSLAFSEETGFITRSANSLSLPRIGLSYGNIRFIRTKLFLGRYWDMLKRLKGPGEGRVRRMIARKQKQMQ